MREILFRGKDDINGEWRTGFMVDSSHIGNWVYACPVDPETVGQFTGLADKNGEEIFEGDIVKQTFEKTVAIAIADFWDGDEYADLYGEDVGVVVILPSKGACIKNPIIHREVNGVTTQDGETAKMYKNICSGRCEVIGNIHDNPELLEVQHEIE